MITGSGIMRSALIRKLLPGFTFFIIVIVAGCSPTQATPTPSPSATLFPFAPASITPTNEQVQPIYTAIPSPGPTPTPFVHIVQKDDTLLGIAILYGVSLEEIMAANPEINPRILSIDQEILVPSLEGDVPGGLIPTATPIPLQLAPVLCYPTLSEQSWCISSVYNVGEFWLEGVSAIITIFNPDGEQINAELAHAPLNLLPPGFTMPLGVMFSQSVDLAVATTNSSFLAQTIEGRYVLMVVDWEINADQSSDLGTIVSGSVQVSPDNEFGTDEVGMLVTAFDQNGNVVGFRKWDRTESVAIGESFEFEIEVFSLGPPIARVEVLVEAFPAAHIE
jgi:LysM repeat protein